MHTKDKANFKNKYFDYYQTFEAICSQLTHTCPLTGVLEYMGGDFEKWSVRSHYREGK